MHFVNRFLKKNKILTKKIAELEKKISSLEATLHEVQHIAETKNNNHITDPPKKETSPSILVEQLKVEQIVIHHVDYANNFGQLGIKELTGKLNIGTNYEGQLSDKINEIVNEKLNEKLGRNAKVHLRPKKEE